MTNFPFIDAGIEEQVTGTKHSIMENGTDFEEHIRETPMDRAMRLMDEQGIRVFTVSVFET